MSKILCILCILFNLWAAPIICWYFRELERVARSMQPVCRQRRSKLQKSLKYLSSYIINDNLYLYLSCISYIINDKPSYSKSRNYATPPDENEDEVLHNQWLFVLQKRFWCFLKSGNCAVFAVLEPITIHHLSYISRDCIPLDYFLWYKRGLTMLFWSNGSETKADHLLDWLLVSIVWRCPLISSTELFPHFLSHFNTFLKSYIFFAFCLRFTAFPFIFKQQCWEILRLE